MSRSNGSNGVVVTPIGVLTLLLRRARLVVVVPLATATIAVLAALYFRDYTARSRFVTSQATSQMSRVAGLAAQFGIDVGQGPSAESPTFYVELIGSGEILRSTVLSEYRFARSVSSPDTVTGTLLDLLGIEAETEASRVQAGIDALRDRIDASASAKSGIVTLTTRFPSAPMAEEVNARILEVLSEFETARRRSQASAERAFVQERVAAARSELESAEADLSAFLDRNRQSYQSPRLTMEAGRLERRAAIQQQVFASLAQAWEQARIEEVRNTPIITVIDQPRGTGRPTRGPIVTGAIGLLLGGLAAMGLVFALEYFDRRRDSDELNDLRRALTANRWVARSSVGR